MSQLMVYSFTIMGYLVALGGLIILVLYALIAINWLSSSVAWGKTNNLNKTKEKT